MSNSTFINPNCIEVETNNGDVYLLGFINSMNYRTEQQCENFTTRCINALFDKYYDGTQDSIWSTIAAGMLRNNLNSFIWCHPNKDIERERIGNRIKEIRTNLGIDAKTLAERVHIDAGNLSRIEKGRFSVGLDILCKIASVLNMKIDFVPQKTIEKEIKL